MKILPRWKIPKLSKVHSSKKVILNLLRGSGKWLGAGLLMGTGAELASHVASKVQGPDDGQYVSITDFGPALFREDSVEASNDGHRGRGLFGSRHRWFWGIPTFIIAIVAVLACRFCWRRMTCLGGLASCCWSPKPRPKDEAADPTAPSHQEAVDMEAAFARMEHKLENDIHSPTHTEGGSHYATPKKQVEDAIQDIRDSCANRAKEAHDLDRSFHST